MDRIEYIKELQEKSDFKTTRKQSVIINNFFSLITIIMVTIAILLYVNYVVPAQDAKKARELKEYKHKQYLKKRAKQIALSHKLNSTKRKDTNATN